MDSVEGVEGKSRGLGQDRGRRWETLTDWARAQTAFVLTPLARAIGRSGIHPNTMSVLGLFLNAGVGVAFATGRIVSGGLLLLIVGPIDALDGAVARLLGKQSRFGAFLDSTLDRISDAVLILGLVVHFMLQQAALETALLLISLVAAMMVSYIRARAEALGFACKVGLLTRMERVGLIIVLATLGLPTLMAWALAVLSVFTVGQRLLHVYRVFQESEATS